MRDKCVIYGIYIFILIIGITIYSLVLLGINKKYNTEQNTPPIQINDAKIDSNNKKAIDNKSQTINSKTEEENKNQQVYKQKDKKQESKNTLYIINVNVANVRETPSVNAKIINKYKLNDEVVVTKKINKWAELKNGGFIYIDLLSIKQ